jgi:hypothetical protein
MKKEICLVDSYTINSILKNKIFFKLSQEDREYFDYRRTRYEYSQLWMNYYSSSHEYASNNQEYITVS